MKKIDTPTALKKILTHKKIEKTAFQGVDFTVVPIEELEQICFTDCLFLDCHIPPSLNNRVMENNYLFPRLNVPYNIYPAQLYTKETLYKNYQPQDPSSYLHTPDKIIYDYYQKMGVETRNIKETLARTLHDHSINDAMHDLLATFEEKKTVAIMGGHQISRTDKGFLQIAQLAKTLTEKGHLMLSGGGPGAMEATHLGAWMAGKSKTDLAHAISILSPAPTYADRGWLQSAFEVMRCYPQTRYVSLGIPTWLYGHELSTPFATHIAKLFENSLREEGLLAVAKGGVIFAPGSAGTMQEIFMDLAQNHYVSYGYASPMVFLNKKYWTKKRPIYPLIEKMEKKGDLKNLNIGIYDTNDDVIAHLSRFSQQ